MQFTVWPSATPRWAGRHPSYARLLPLVHSTNAIIRHRCSLLFYVRFYVHVSLCDLVRLSGGAEMGFCLFGLINLSTFQHELLPVPCVLHFIALRVFCVFNLTAVLHLTYSLRHCLFVSFMSCVFIGCSGDLLLFDVFEVFVVLCSNTLPSCLCNVMFYSLVNFLFA